MRGGRGWLWKGRRIRYASFTEIAQGLVNDANCAIAFLQGEYQVDLLPPEGRGGPVRVKGYQSNHNTHTMLTEGALLDENGTHIYPIQGPPLTVMSHFGPFQALGACSQAVRRCAYVDLDWLALTLYNVLLQALCVCPCVSWAAADASTSYAW